MAVFERDGVTLHYEIFGSGSPVLLLAPGGMRSSVAFWERAPWNPITELSRDFWVIAMDQRNAGRSSAPISGHDGWHTYTHDHVALLDHLEVERALLLGGCIGGSFCLALAEHAPERVAAAVLQQPIGLSPQNRHAFYEMFDGWAAELRASRPDVTEQALRALREHLYGGSFVFSVSREFVAACATPLLVLRGNDLYHPAEVSEEIARLAPRAQLIAEWKEGESTARAVDEVRRFLTAHAES